MIIHSDVQKLEPGEKIQLVEVDGSAFGGPVL
ncbi:MAG TPA: phage minor tail protein L, partial [Arsenophonus apicola]